jgi:hypothetical protein
MRLSIDPPTMYAPLQTPNLTLGKVVLSTSNLVRMSTHAVIARETDPGCFRGRYHHLDGNPITLGYCLQVLYRGGLFPRHETDYARLQASLLDDHPGGWITIMGHAELSESLERSNPFCFCHSLRPTWSIEITEANAARFGCDYGYVFLKGPKPRLRVLAIEGLFGPRSVIPTTDQCTAYVEAIAEVDLDGSFADWREIEKNADAARRQAMQVMVKEFRPLSIPGSSN